MSAWTKVKKKSQEEPHPCNPPMVPSEYAEGSEWMCSCGRLWRADQDPNDPNRLMLVRTRKRMRI